MSELEPLKKKGKFSGPFTKKLVYLDIIFNINTNERQISQHKIECDFTWKEYGDLEEVLKITNQTIGAHFRNFWGLMWAPIHSVISSVKNHIDHFEPLSEQLDETHFAKLMSDLPDFFNNNSVPNDRVTLSHLLELETNLMVPFESYWIYPSTGERKICSLRSLYGPEYEIDCLIGQTVGFDPDNKDNAVSIIGPMSTYGEQQFNIVVPVNIDSNPMNFAIPEESYGLNVYHKMLRRCIPLFWNAMTPPPPGKIFPNRTYIPARIVIERLPAEATERQSYNRYSRAQEPPIKTTVRQLNNSRAQESLNIITNQNRENPEGLGVIVENLPPEMQYGIQQFAKGKQIAKGKRVYFF